MIATIIVLSIINLFFIWNIIRATKKRKVLKERLRFLESRVNVISIPEYVKHYNNYYGNVYKIRDIRIVPQNEHNDPELCAVITGESKRGGTLNATIDKFITATEEEYNNNKRDELNF